MNKTEELFWNKSDGSTIWTSLNISQFQTRPHDNNSIEDGVVMKELGEPLENL